jgi:Domain of unknown function (DUF4271)
MEAKSTGVSKFCNKVMISALAGLCFLLLAGESWSQAAPIHYDPSPLTGGLSPVLNLQGIWFDEYGNRHLVPFNYFDRDEMTISHTFDLPSLDELQDTLYLYCEAIAWSSEINLNGRLLAVTDDPFAEHLLPLDKSWLLPVGNRLEIRLSTHGLSFPWYPKHFLGVFRQLLLLQVDSLPRFPKFPVTVGHAPKAALFAAWSVDQQYKSDSEMIMALGQGLFSFPYRVPIAFPFRPSNKSMAILAAMGWEVLANPDGADSLAAYNSFPFSTEAEHKNLHFWRDADMRPTAYYGDYQRKESVNNPELNEPDKVSLLLLIFIPVLCMFLLKMLAPRAYGSLGEYLTKTKIYMELIVDNKFLKVEQRWLMNSMRMIITAVTVALFLYYVQLSESWRVLNIFSGRSVLYRTLYGTSMPPWEIFWWALVVTLTLNLVKYFVINGIGTIFRVFSLGPSIQNLDVFCSFPLNLVPFLPATFIYFLDPISGGILLRVWAILFLLYGARRLWLMSSGLGRLYQISRSLKILYICTLEILPWIILI